MAKKGMEITQFTFDIIPLLTQLPLFLRKIAFGQCPTHLHGHDWLLLQLQETENSISNGTSQVRPNRYDENLDPYLRKLFLVRLTVLLIESSAQGAVP